LCGGDRLVEVSENLLDHHRIFDAGHYPDGPAAGSTGLDVDTINTFEALYLSPIEARRAAGCCASVTPRL
jgi:hypothetical protein